MITVQGHSVQFCEIVAHTAATAVAVAVAVAATAVVAVVPLLLFLPISSIL